MTMLTDWPLALLWTCWAGYWAVAAAGIRVGKRAEPRLSRIAHIVLVVLSFLLLFFEPLHKGPLGHGIFPDGPAPDVLGFSLAALGLGLATWSRIHLGQNWSGAVAIRSEQSLTESGPYAFVRHPIYCGVLAAIAGSAIGIGKLGAALAIPIATLAYWRKTRIEEAWLVQEFGEAYESYRRRVGALLPFRRLRSWVRDTFARSRRHLLDPAELDRTIDRLQVAGELTADRAQRLRLELPHALRESAYVLRHLGAHLAIGVIFAFDVVPLPLGTVGRVLWVVANRAYESAFGTRERAQVHSLKVLLVAAIPWIGYGAYLLPLRRESLELTWLFAQHLSYRLYGTSFEEFLARKPRMIRRAGARLFPTLSEHDGHREARRAGQGG